MSHDSDRRPARGKQVDVDDDDDDDADEVKKELIHSTTVVKHSFKIESNFCHQITHRHVDLYRRSENERMIM